jgi:hypothetical protein
MYRTSKNILFLEIIGSSILKIFTNQMQPPVKQNENSSLINKNWTDNSTLDEIVKYEYQNSNKSKYIQKDLQILEINSLHFLGDWKEVTQEQKKSLPIGLVNFFNKKAGIEPENVSSRKKRRDFDIYFFQGKSNF